MVLRYNIVEFKKLNLKGFTKFCLEYGYKVEMSVRMDASGLGIKMYDKERNVGIFTQYAKAITDEDKKSLLEENYDEHDAFYDVYKRCDYEFGINISSVDELKLAYIFAIYISNNTELTLINYDNGTLMDTEGLRKISNDELELLCDKFKIKLKYAGEIEKWKEYSATAFKYSTWFWILLIIASFVATIMLILMILVYEINNFLVLALPFILIAIAYGYIIIRDYVRVVKSRKQIKLLNFKYETEICELYKDRTPKKPSGKRKNIKQTVINIMGILIVPGLIGGSVLMACNHILIGLLIILFPWIVLIGIKFFITDKKEEAIKARLYVWLDSCFNEMIADEVIALNFNLYEKKNNNWTIELIGCTKFDESNTRWTLDDSYRLSSELFEFNLNYSWEEIEYLLINMIKGYFVDLKKMDELKRYKAITIGFNDGVVRYLYFNVEEDK